MEILENREQWLATFRAGWLAHYQQTGEQNWKIYNRPKNSAAPAGKAITLSNSRLVLIASAVLFLRDRSSFGRPLAENDAILAKIADLRVSIDAARLLTERAATMVDAGIPCAREAAMAKLFASEVATNVTATALHLHGGIGFTTQTPVERLFRDSQAFTIGEGTSEIMRLIIGRSEFPRDR